MLSRRVDDMKVFDIGEYVESELLQELTAVFPEIAYEKRLMFSKL